MSIAVVGNTFVDIKGFPFGEYIPAGRNAGKVEFVHGGVGRNIAGDLGSIGLKPVYVSMCDATAVGKETTQQLINLEVNTDYIVECDGGLGMWLAVFNEKGDVVGAISKRPDSSALERLIDEKGDEIFKNCDSIIMEIDIDINIATKVFEYAEKYGKRIYAVIANMSIARQRREMLEKTDCIVFNEQEAGIFFSDGEIEGKEPEVILEKVKEHMKGTGFKSVVVTLGSRGSVYIGPGESGFCPANDVVVVDTTGAGDAFCAGVAAGLTYGVNLKSAVTIGTFLAAATITASENVCPKINPKSIGLDI